MFMHLGGFVPPLFSNLYVHEIAEIVNSLKYKSENGADAGL
jgi:hypothetical protein